MNAFIIANISFSVTLKDLILLLVLYEKGGKQLVLSIGVHVEAKKLLKMFAFLRKSETIDKEMWYCWEFFIIEQTV